MNDLSTKKGLIFFPHYIVKVRLKPTDQFSSILETNILK